MSIKQYRIQKGLQIDHMVINYETEKTLEGTTTSTATELRFGDQGVDGSWRIRIVDEDLLFEKRVSGSFIEKMKIDLPDGIDSEQDDHSSAYVFEDTVNSTKYRFFLTNTIAFFSIQWYDDIEGRWEIVSEISDAGGNSDSDWQIIIDSGDLLFQRSDNNGSSWDTKLTIEG